MTDKRIYDLCVVGAGIAGLNALFVAKQYLPASSKVALIDRHPGAGGMWNSTYDYVRLHQPHAMFTAGDIPWRISKPDSYLATGNEVQAHLAHCLEVIAQGWQIDTYWNCHAEIGDELGSGDGITIELSLTPGNDHGIARTIVAKQVINAKGLDIPDIAPLQLSSREVTSTTPQALSKLPRDHRAIYVVGGGKTGMDTALMAAETESAGPVYMLAGKGTLFTRRDQFFPTGLRRYFNRTSNLKTTIDLVMRFDGSDADQVFEHFRTHYSISPGDRGDHFLFGIQSESESARIRAGTHAFIYDYLEDVVDTETGPELRLRHGTARPMERDAIIVNCSGYVFRNEEPEPPLLSSGGKILSITSRESFNFLSSVSAYFLSHLWFSGKIRDVPFYILDQNALMQKDRKTWQLTGSAQGLLNAILISQALPFRVFQQFGLDFDRWHPFYKRLAGLIDLQFHNKKYAQHCRHVLDQVAATHGVMCRPLSNASQ